MSQTPPDDFNVIGEGGLEPRTGDYQYPPQPAQNRPTQGESNFIDGSGPIFSMYMEMASEEDKKMAERWTADADGILIFTGLFSAAVASLISVSIQDIQQNPQDISNFYLANTYQATINPNVSSSLPAAPPPFSPPNYAVWVNALWFLSLVISLTCALLATLLQQWARRYLRVTQSRYSPHKRARIRAFFSEGVEKCLLPWAVETLPTLLHVSLFLFFAGVTVFLWNVNLTIFKLILSWVGVCTALYGAITLMPIFRHDSPYYTPLSLPAWHIVTRILFVTFQILQWFTACWRFTRFRVLTRRYHKSLMLGMQKTAEETALNSPPEIDTRAFMWTLDCLDEDHELERFFSGLPGFRSSKMVEDPLPHLTEEQQEKLVNAWIGLSDRTFSSDLLPEPVKKRRTVICAKAIGSADIPIELVFRRIASEDQFGPVQSSQIVHLLRGWDNGKDEEITMVLRAIVSSVVARAQRRDDVWFAIASSELGVPEFVLRNHASHSDDLSLAVLIHVVRRQLNLFCEPHWPGEKFWGVLKAASNFNVLNTSPGLQHEFCALWNEVIRYRCEGPCQRHDHDLIHFFMEDALFFLERVHYILAPIRKIFVALHQDSDFADIRQFCAAAGVGRVDPYTYPSCNMRGHLPSSTPSILDVSASSTNTLTVLHDDDPLIPPPLARNSHAPSTSVPAVVLVDDNSMFVPLDNNVPVMASFRPAHQTVPDFLPNPATSPDPAAAGTARDIETSARAMPFTTPDASTSTTYIHPSSTVSLQNNKDLAQTDAQEILSRAPPEPVLDNILPTSVTSPGTSQRPTSAPELGATTKDEDSPSIDHFPSSVNRAIQADTMVTLDVPPQYPPLPSATDIPIAGPSRREPDIGHAGDRPPQPLRGQYGIV